MLLNLYTITKNIICLKMTTLIFEKLIFLSIICRYLFNCLNIKLFYVYFNLVVDSI